MRLQKAVYRAKVNKIMFLYLTVACPVGTFHRQQSSTCTLCPHGTYQDEEGKRTCKPCGEGETTRGQGSGARKDCFLERGNTPLEKTRRT